MECIEKFNDWMLKIKSVHYSDHEKMINAYKIIQDEEQRPRRTKQ